MSISPETRNRWNERIEFCSLHDFLLTEWECGFLDSLDESLSTGKDLSHKQSKVLSKIFHKIEEKVG